MHARNFPVLAAFVVSSALIGCGNQTPVGPDPALAGSSPPPGGAQSPPPNTSTATTPKTSQGTLQDLCRSVIVKKALGGVARVYVKFPAKDNSTTLVDVCRKDGAEQVSYETFKFKNRTDLHVATNACPTSDTKCWYKVFDIQNKSDDLGYSTLDELGIAGRYKVGEDTQPLPGSALLAFGVLTDESGKPSATVVKYVTKYTAPPASDDGPFLTVKRYEEDMSKLDLRLAKIESNTATLMASYSDWLRAKEAM